MNAVQDFLSDRAKVEETLVIPAKIRTQAGYLVETRGLTWHTPPTVSNFHWGEFQDLGIFLRVLQSYTAALLEGKSEDYSNNLYVAYKSVGSSGGWKSLADKWITHGVVDFDSMLKIWKGLHQEHPKVAVTHFRWIRGWYLWAAELRIPGFTAETVDQLKEMNLGRDIAFLARQKLVPESIKSKSSKNRRTYTEVDFAKIQAALLHLEGRLNAGEIFLGSGSDFLSLSKSAQSLLEKSAKIISTKHLVLGWLACMFAERPRAYSLLRESSFEFYEVDGTQLGSVVFSGEVKRSYGRCYKPAERSKLPLVAQLVRLLPKLMKENRAWATDQGIDPDCDLPLFPIKHRSATGSMRKTLDDEASRLTRDPGSLSGDLKGLFRVLNVRASDGTQIIPTFYSFRDGNHTRWTQVMPLECVVEITGKSGIGSFKHYVKPGIRHVSILDTVPEYTDLVEQLKSPVPTEALDPRARIPSPYPYVIDGKRRVGVEGGCGCFGGSCPMAFDGTVDCYVCPAFTPVVEGPHEWTLKVLIDKKADMIQRGLPRSEWSRYDRHIAAVGQVIQLVQEHWQRRRKERTL